MPLTILAISGSPAPLSHSLVTTQFLKSILEKNEGYHVNLWDLRANPLPFYNPPTPKATHPHQYTHSPQKRAQDKFLHLAQEACAFIIATPNYHGSFSGLLKNAIDYLSNHQMAHKPILITVNGGGYFASSPCDQLRIVIRSLHGLPLPTQLVTNPLDFDEDTTGNKTLTNSKIIQRAQEACTQLHCYIKSFQNMS